MHKMATMGLVMQLEVQTVQNEGGQTDNGLCSPPRHVQSRPADQVTLPQRDYLPRRDKLELLMRQENQGWKGMLTAKETA